ncbi:hepatocyte growth factor activator isoform X2 [Betta splendens]|uniref:trypsin n=1 Tax=Betta splendens TaxID=158456 RepID=A0A6P7LWD2_BETSP|nr:hepatocyte growth factor activator isoform X2 [Betta splendens]
MMPHIALLFLPLALISRAGIFVSGYEAAVSSETRKVLTTTGKECRFPFRQGGRLHHRCITVLSPRPWCSLTRNFDRDRQWGFCTPDRTHANGSAADPCQVNPCQNGGVCAAVARGHAFGCSCPEGFSGRRCEQKRCFESLHLRYYDTGESWGRVHMRNVERCTCAAGAGACERVHYTMCRSNPCQNGGTCRLITSTGTEVCNCRHGYSGRHCDVEPDAACYNGRGSGYRGAASTTASGARCLPWNWDLLHDELHAGAVAAALRGLGEHAYCRNPDGDAMPWCYTLHDNAISWEYCGVPPCATAASSSRMTSVLNVLPTPKKPAPAEPARKPVCGKKHKKRLSMPTGRILGGTAALPGTHPWMAAIYMGQSDFCAGTLISSCWVVSAAHCFFRNYPKSQLRVVLGQQHFNVTNPNTRTFGVADYIFPKQFSVFNPTLHDIVLIKLKKQNGRCAKKTPFIRPICLPDKDTAFPDHYCCSISGWGHMHEKARDYSSLQEAGVRLIPHDTCRRPEVYGNHVTGDMLCAGLNGCVDACQGDSGGPLACVRGDVSFLYGIVSWGEGCGRSGKPGVYTRVPNYIDWINSVIKGTAKAS